MKKFFSLTKKKKRLSGTPDSGSVLSGGYELKDKDLGKVHKAAAVGDVGKLKELAEKHDINQLDKENRTALHISCASGHIEVVHFLLERKARLNLCDNHNRSALMKAVQCQHERCVRILLENHADPNLVDIDDNTALHLAASIPSISTAVLLLEHDADIDAQNKDGFTPLTMAVSEDHIEMAEFLLREGADVNIVDKDHRSPLMIAAGNGLIGMLRLLLQFNAEVALKDTKGWSADDYAVMNGYHPCSLLINEHSIKKNNGQSPSLPGLSKEKKHSPLGSPSQNVGAAVCLGGPATSKYDSEDNSQSESQSRDIESVCDDWPSSEDDSLLSEAKPQKANLMKMLASKRREVPALPDRTIKDTKTDPDSEYNVPSTIFLPKEHPVDPSPSILPSKAPQLTSISPSDCKKPPHSKDGTESQDESPESEESEEDEEREEEEEEDDDEDEDDDDEDEEEEDEEDDEEDDEEGEEEELNESEDDDKGVISIQARAASFEDVEKACVTGEKIPDIHMYDNRDSGAGVSGDENSVDDLKTRTQQIAGASYAIPVTFDVEHDSVFSAVRVESKLSDEDESLGKENTWSTEQNKDSHITIRKLSRFPASSEVEEDETNRETEMNNGIPRRKKQIGGDTVWMDSNDEEDSHKMGFGPNAVLAEQTKEYGVENKGSSDVKDDTLSHRSSQDFLSGQCSPGPPQYNKTATEDTNDDSYWDSACKSKDQNVHLPFLKNEEVSVVTGSNPGEQQCCEDASLISIGSVSDEPSHSVSPVPDKEDETKKQIQHNLDVDSCGQSSKEMLGSSDLGNDQIDDSHLDDNYDSCRSTVKGDVLKSPYTSANFNNTRIEEVDAVEVDDNSSEDCDQMEYSLGRTIAKVFDVGDGSNNAGNELAVEQQSRLNSCICLESGNAFTRTEMSPSDLRGQPTTDDVTAVENCDSRRNCADDLLLQTDIDDVDLDSPDEAKCVVERSKEVTNTEGPITQASKEHIDMSEEDYHDGEEISSGEEEIKEVRNKCNDGESQHVVDEALPEVQCEKPKFGLASVLGKLEGDKDRKLDLMEELGLSGVDDLDAHGADESDWDSDSASSQRNSPGQRIASPGLQEENCSNSSVKEQDEDDYSDAPVLPQRSIIASKTSKSSPPQPSARKMVFQKKETVKGSPEPLSSSIHGQTNVASDKQDNKSELHTCELGLSKPFPLGPMESDRVQNNTVFKDELKAEETAEGQDNVPLEKHCENLWIEVENKEVNHSFRMVTDDLNEKFEELIQPRNVEKETVAESVSSGEEFSDEDIEVKTRSTDHFSTSTQSESKPKDLTHKPMYEDETHVQDQPASLNRRRQDPDQITEEDCRSPLSNYTREQKDGRKPGFAGAMKTHLDVNWKHNIATTDITVRSQENKAQNDLEECTRSLPPLLNRNTTSVSRISDEELEEDVQRFKHEVGKLKAAFRDREKEKPHLPKEVGIAATYSPAERRNCSSSWDSASLTEDEQSKPEALLECLSSQAKQQPTPTKRVPVQMQQQQPKTGTKEGKQAELSPSVITSHHRAPQPNTHTEDPLSPYDDGSLDGISHEEGRLSANGMETRENPEHLEMAEDFADLTHSSDSSIDDMESPLSEQTALFIQKLNSTLDSSIIIELQNIIYKYNHSIQKEKYRNANLANKVSYLEMEKADLKSSLEEVKSDRTGLELNQLELQAELRNLKLQLKQEHEEHSNATREKLKVMEEQQQFEVQEREKVEFTLRNLELENTKLGNNLKQLEEDYDEIQKLLAQERSARIQQENLFNNCLRKQQETEEENKQNISKSNEALTRLTEVSSRERETLLQIATLQEQLTTSKRDLEHSHAHSSLRESTLLEENRTLKSQLEDARRDLKLNSESLKNSIFSSNNEVTSLRSELAEARTRLENERHTCEKLETDLESIRNRLSGAEKEAERSHVAKSEKESTLLREKEEHQHLKGKLTGEVSILREENNNLSQKLIKAEAQANNLENEVHRVSQQLKDKGLLQEVLQREKDQAVTRGLELEKTLHAEREQFSRDRARHEATQERLTQAQSEVMLLRQQLEEAQNKGLAKERAVTDAQGHLKDILSKLQSDYEERVQLVKERNKELDSKAADLQDHIHKLQEEKNELKTCLRQAQQELADSLKKLSMSEASLEVNTRYRNDLEEEKARLFKDMDRLKRKLEENGEQYTQAERRIHTLTSSLDEKEKELSSAAQKLQVSLSTSAAYETTIKQLEQDMQRLEIENARLEATANKQSKEINTLQKGTHEASLVRNHLEDLVAKLTFEEQLNREVQKQSTQSHTAKDTQVLWEQELKSRTQLGLRLAQLEKEKGALSNQMEAEKNKAIHLEEQRKAIDIRLDLELKRNTELQKEMYRLRTLLKTAKKKLKDQDRSGIEFGSSGQISNKVDRMQLQLEQEVSLRRQLEKVNEELKDQLASVKSTSHKKDQLEMRKKQLDEEVGLYRRDAEERARQELQEKLDQVNLFLQSQAASQEVLEQKKANKEANLRFQLEQRIDELEGELRRARDSHRSTRMELERYQKLYTDELQLHKSLTDKLDRTTYQLKESHATLLNERNKSFASGILDLDSLGSLHYGDTKGQPSRGVSLGLPLLSPVTEGQSSRVGDYIAKMQSELERSISNEIKNATAELENASARLSPVGSVSRTDLHPVSMATQQYLEVLKKKNMI